MRGIRYAAIAALLAALTMPGCTPATDSGPGGSCPPAATPPEGAPGEADVLLTFAVGQGRQDLTQVVYEDGWVLSLTDATPEALAAVRLPRYVPSPYDDGPMAWRIGYLNECELTQVIELSERVVSEDIDFGDVMITDQASTYVTRYGPGEPATVDAYALGQEQHAGGLSRGQRAAREDLIALGHLAGSATTTGEVLQLSTLRVWVYSEVELPPEWPGPPLADFLGEAGCGELTGDEARAVYEYLLTEPDELDGVHAAAVPPGVSVC